MVVVAIPIAWRPAHFVLASSASEQRLPRWRWSIAKALERVTESDLMLASPGRVFRSNCRLGSLVAGGRTPPAELADRHLRGKGERRAVDGVEVGGEVRDRPLIADSLRGDREGAAVGRVDHEVRFVDIDLDRAHPDRDPADDLGNGFRVGDHVGVGRVDIEGDADDDGAVVIGTRQGGGDRDQR